MTRLAWTQLAANNRSGKVLARTNAHGRLWFTNDGTLYRLVVDQVTGIIGGEAFQVVFTDGTGRL